MQALNFLALLRTWLPIIEHVADAFGASHALAAALRAQWAHVKTAAHASAGTADDFICGLLDAPLEAAFDLIEGGKASDLNKLLDALDKKLPKTK